MAIGAYPRTAVQGAGNGQNPQNGLSLMFLNPETNTYQAATANNFISPLAANAANQVTQINLLKLLNGGESGSRLINAASGAVTGLTVYKIVVNEDAVLSVLLDSQSANLLTDYNYSGRTITKGMVIVTKGFPITNITVTSGSILIYGQ